MSHNFKRLVNMLLHGITLGSRFLFVFFLAKFIEPSLVGYYGIFTATVGYSLYFVGLDFYTYVSRAIVKTPASKRGQLLKGHAALSGLLYLAYLPFCIWFLSQVKWPEDLIWWFLPILMLEHFNQEVSRLLIALSEQLTSSFITFIRQGSWALAIITMMSLSSDKRNLNDIMFLWAVAGFAAACLGIWKLKRLKTEGWHLPIDWAWIKKGVAVSVAFLLATLALRGVQTFDRYWLEALGGIESVGAYILLLGVAGTLLTFLDAAVFSFAYPALIKLNHEGDQAQAQNFVKNLFLQTFILAVIFSITSWLMLPYFLEWIGNAVYQKNMYWYPWLLSAMILNAFGMVPHYALYAQGKDKTIIFSHFLSLIAFVVTTWLATRAYGKLAVPIGLNAAFAVILIFKLTVYLAVTSKEKPKSVPVHA